MTKEWYIDWIEKIFFKHNLSGSLLEFTYITGIKTEDLTSCYVDSRVINGNILRKELDKAVEQFLIDYPNAKKTLYL